MERILIAAFLLCLVVMPASASYNKTFLPTEPVVVNQSVVQDPTGGASVPWDLYVISGLAGLVLIVMSLVRSKTQRMDYEINIVISVLAWPFIWYWTWAGFNSVDYIAGVGVTSATSGTVMITQHILYSFWLLGWIGVAGSVFAAFVTALLVAQYNLFRDNEAEANAKQQQSEMRERS